MGSAHVVWTPISTVPWLVVVAAFVGALSIVGLVNFIMIPCFNWSSCSSFEIRALYKTSSYRLKKCLSETCQNLGTYDNLYALVMYQLEQN